MKYLVLMALLCSFALAEEAKDHNQEEMMKKWMTLATPGEQHKLLSKMTGKWTYINKWWEKPEAPPKESKGTSTAKMVMGGRFLIHEIKGKLMGHPYEGMAITGYDNLKKKFDTIWFDNMSTGIMYGKGEFNPKTKTLTDKGEFTCPMEADSTAEYRGEWKIVNDDNMVYTMYGTFSHSGNKEIKTMEINYKRIK